MLEHALAYLQRGWSVIPCRGKQPAIQWQPYTSRLPTEDEVRGWWERWPDANIAVICGAVSGLVVVDVDVDRGGKVEGQEQTGLTARTGGGGYHLFYQYPRGTSTRVPNRVGADGVDVRADGGYVIVAPSSHKSGNRYAWLQEDEPAPCPRWVLDKPKREKGSEQEKWLVNLLNEPLQVGTRNDSLARLAGYYAGKDIPVDVTEVLVSQWMASQGEPLDPEEIRVTVQSVYRTEMRNRTQNRTRKQQRGTVDSPFATMRFGDYMQRFGSSEIKWLVDGWLPDATIAFTASPPGGLKTWSMFDLAISVASGRPFLGVAEVNDPGPVLIIQQEDFHGQVAERLSVIAMGRLGLGAPGGDGEHFTADLLPDLPIFLHPDRQLRFDDPAVLDGLEAAIKEIRPRLVIIDPLYSAASTDDYMTKSASDMFVLKRMRDTYGCSFFISHHTRKSSESFDRQEMWGSQFLNAFLETGWQVRKVEDEEAVIIKRHFKVSGAQEPVKVVFDIDTGPACKYITSVEEIDADAAKQVAAKKPSAAIEAYLTVMDELGSATVADIVDATGRNKSTVGRALKSMLEQGLVAKQDGGRWVRVVMPDY